MKNKIILTEETIKNLLNLIDDNFKNHKKWYEDYKKNGRYKIVKIKDDEIHFNVKPSGRWKTKHQKYYKAVLKFPTLKKIIKKLPDKPSLKAVIKCKKYVEEVFFFDDVEVFCSCKSASYFGYNYILSNIRSKYGNLEKRFPHKANPLLRGSVCKHLHYILEDFLNPYLIEMYIDLYSFYVLRKKYKNFDENKWKQYLKWKAKL